MILNFLKDQKIFNLTLLWTLIDRLRVLIAFLSSSSPKRCSHMPNSDLPKREIIKISSNHTEYAIAPSTKTENQTCDALSILKLLHMNSTMHIARCAEQYFHALIARTKNSRHQESWEYSILDGSSYIIQIDLFRSYHIKHLTLVPYVYKCCNWQFSATYLNQHSKSIMLPLQVFQ